MTYEPNHPSFDPNVPEGVDEDDIFRYDARCDFDSDWNVGASDLALFAEEWLWTACWKQSRMNRFVSAEMEMMGGESMMMAIPLSVAETSPVITSEEQAANIEDIITFLNNVWLNDKDLKKTISNKNFVR